MVNHIFDKIINKLIDSELILAQDKAIYTYGLKQGALILVNIFTVIVLGIAFEMLWESLVLIIAYVPLRSFAGGYHADSSMRCYFFSVLMIVAGLKAIEIIKLTELSLIIYFPFFLFIIFILAPFESENKRLNKKEKEVYGEKTKIILLIEIVIALLFVASWRSEVAKVIFVAIIMESFMLILGFLKRKVKGKLYEKNSY